MSESKSSFESGSPSVPIKKQSTGSAHRILVVDDLEIGRQVLKSALSSLGFDTVDEAKDGIDALRLIALLIENNQAPSVILCDWKMPGLDGLQVLQALLKDPATSLIPFIMLTAEEDNESILAAMSAGASDYIVKPVGLDSLERKIRRWLPAKYA